LKSRATHVLLIARRRKAQRLREVMRMRGVDEAQLGRLAAPAGPDAGAKAPAEIALVAIVGVLAILRGRAQAAVIPTPPEVAGQDEEPRAPRSLSPHAEEAQAVPAGRFVNPVCGIAVDIAAPKHIETFEGTAYYFCCDGCLATFRKDPARYAAIHRASLARA